jgi:uncharacterized surface protein with fasciclin (FAS1) repeats
MKPKIKKDMKRTNFFRTTMAVLMASATLGLTSCDKDDDPVPEPQQKSITQTVVDGADFSLLEAAVIRAGLADTLNNLQNLTVFAPNNAAFTAAGLTEAVINTTPVATLKAILRYHVLTSKVLAAGVPAGPNASVATLNGANIFLTKNAKVFVNGVEVISADVNASNGVVINRVLFPPPGNIVAIAAANPNLTYLVAAVTRASTSGTDVAAALSGAGPLTVFAPTNQAFIDAGFPTIASINAADANTLKNILLYHVIGARVFSSDLSEGLQPTTLGGGKVTITLAGGPKVKGIGNTVASGITATDIVATNGVIHLIDRVLLP